MKQILKVQIKGNGSVCPIHIGAGIMEGIKKNETVKRAGKVCIITDTVVSSLWLPHLTGLLGEKKACAIIIPTGEKNKTMSTLENILNQMIAKGLDRSSVVVTLGGGVVCDIGGLAAGLFMRGIPVIHIPTTLLAQVDASIGGKTAVDMNGLKNMVGMFHQPEAVYIDTQTLSTLPLREHRAGCAEIIKHAVIADKSIIALMNEGSNEKDIIRIIGRSCRVKQQIIQKDEQEKKGERKKLNFGHTVGHAIESLSHTKGIPLLHGEAVALGMVAEARMSVLMGKLSLDDETTITECIRKTGLQMSTSVGTVEEIIKLMKHDKKNKGATILFSLPTQVGGVVSDCVVPPNIMRRAINHILKKNI